MTFQIVCVALFCNFFVLNFFFCRTNYQLTEEPVLETLCEIAETEPTEDIQRMSALEKENLTQRLVETNASLRRATQYNQSVTKHGVGTVTRSNTSH